MILKNKNYKNYILGRVVSNFGDSIFMQLIIVYCTLEVASSDKYLAINKILQTVPCFLIIFLGPSIDRYKNKKKMLLVLEFVLFLTSIVVLISLKISTLGLMLCGVGFFYFANTSKSSVEMSLKKHLVKDEDVLEFNRTYRITGKILDMFADGVSYYLISVVGYVLAMVLDVATFVFSMFSFSKMEDIISIEVFEEQNILEDIKCGIKHFFDAKIFSKIVIFDGILCGMSTLFMIYFPIYLKEMNLLHILPIYMFLKSLGWFIGTYCATTVTKYLSEPKKLFALDYTLQAILLLGFVLDLNIYIILVIAFIASVPQSVTGVMYDTWALQEYDAKYMGRIDTLITFWLNASSILFAVTPLFFTFTFNEIVTVYLIVQLLIISFGLRLLE